MYEEYFQFEQLPLDTLQTFIDRGVSMYDMGFYQLRIDRTRLKTFTTHGCFCHACGASASFMYTEAHMNESIFQKWYFNPYDNPKPIAHINLYGWKNGDLFMLTSDHVIPRSLGGSNSLTNRIPLCRECNQLKGNDRYWIDDLPRNKDNKLIMRKHKQIMNKRKEHIVCQVS